jgi:hypothetical protein
MPSDVHHLTTQLGCHFNTPASSIKPYATVDTNGGLAYYGNYSSNATGSSGFVFPNVSDVDSGFLCVGGPLEVPLASPGFSPALRQLDSHHSAASAPRSLDTGAAGIALAFLVEFATPSSELIIARILARSGIDYADMAPADALALALEVRSGVSVASLPTCSSCTHL